MIYITAAKGLGNAIYLRAAALHLLKSKEQVTVFTHWNDVFSDLPLTIRTVAERVGQSELRSFACSFVEPMPQDMDEFTTSCLIARLEGPVELRIDWKVRNHALLDRIKRAAAGRKIVVYQPLKRVKNKDAELLAPRRDSYNKFIAGMTDCFRIKLGHPPFVVEDNAAVCELDMYGKAFVLDTFDICTAADMFFGQPSFISSIAEALDKNATIMFSRRALNADTWVRNVTPAAVFHKKHLITAVLDEA